MQRGVSGGDERPTGGRACELCGGPLRTSHRRYAGLGMTTAVLRCGACGHTVEGPTRHVAERDAGRTRSRRHRPVDEGPPSNPVLDPETARRLLEETG